MFLFVPSGCYLLPSFTPVRILNATFYVIFYLTGDIIYSTVFLISVTLCLHIFTAVTKDHLVMGEVGHTVNLPCLSSLEGSCSDIRWFYNTNSDKTLIASISRKDANTGRFNIVSNCSLHIDNITEVDVGIYWCGKESGDFHFLSLITGE